MDPGAVVDTGEHPLPGAATENNKAREACDDHSEPKHHRPAQSLLPRHSSAILSRVTGSTIGGLNPYACSPNASEQSVPYGRRAACAVTILAAEVTKPCARWLVPRAC